MSEIPPLLLVDKPVGITSFDVIRILRKKLGIRKMGHAGTLDPRASGLMLIGVGDGTKTLPTLIKFDKEYVATILVGERRTTGDLEGAIVEERPVTEIFSEEKISVTLTSLMGTITLPVSAYSAIKRDGVPMYKHARKAEAKGEMIADVPIRNMIVKEVELLDYAYDARAGRLSVTVRFCVGSGTYIRSLAEEFGRRLGYPATLAELRRTKVGDFDVRNAQPL